METTKTIGEFIQKISQSKNWCRFREKFVYEIREKENKIYFDMRGLKAYEDLIDRKFSKKKMVDWVMEIIKNEIQVNHKYFDDEYNFVFMFTAKEDREFRTLEPNVLVVNDASACDYCDEEMPADEGCDWDDVMPRF